MPPTPYERENLRALEKIHKSIDGLTAEMKKHRLADSRPVIKGDEDGLQDPIVPQQ